MLRHGTIKFSMFGIDIQALIRPDLTGCQDQIFLIIAAPQKFVGGVKFYSVLCTLS